MADLFIVLTKSQQQENIYGKDLCCEHTCVKDGYSKISKQDVIAKLFLHDVRYDLLFKPSTIQHQIQQTSNLVATIDQCKKKAKAEALKIIQKEHEEKNSYRLEILE